MNTGYKLQLHGNGLLTEASRLLDNTTRLEINISSNKYNK